MYVRMYLVFMYADTHMAAHSPTYLPTYMQGVDIARLSVGDVLCKGKNAVPVTTKFLAHLTTLPSLRFPILRVGR